MKYIFPMFILFFLLSFITPQAQESPLSSSPVVDKKLLGRHMFSLQWISWEKFGVATISEDTDGRLFINARQALNGDEVTLKGDITVIDARTFIVDGELRTKVSHINGGNVCPRTGSFTFKAIGTRKYWRLQEMQNPCDSVVDYVDIFF